MVTAAAAMTGAVVILNAPIFQGLAISLLFGLASSTLPAVLVIHGAAWSECRRGRAGC